MREPRCPSRKRRFPDEISAKIALGEVGPLRDRYKPIRAYPCQMCSGWHLTAQPRRRKDQ